MTGRSTAGCHFFQRLPYGLGTDRVDQAQDHHLVGEQLERPMASTTRRVGARQLDQLLLNVPFDLDLVRPCRLRVMVDGRLDPFGDEPLPDTSDGSGADTYGHDDVLVGVVTTRRGIRQQEDAGMCQLPACGFPFGNQLLQGGALLRIESDTILVHHGAPSLGGDPSQPMPSRERSAALPVNRSLTTH